MTSLSIIPPSNTNPEVETFSAAAFPSPTLLSNDLLFCDGSCTFIRLLTHWGQSSSYFFYQLLRYKRLSYYSIKRSRWKDSFKFSFVYLKHGHHYDFHFGSQLLYFSDKLKTSQCRHPNIR